MNEKLIVLWLIREYGPISVEDLVEKFFNNELPPHTSLEKLRTQNPGTSIFPPIYNSFEQLHQANLIELHEGNPQDYRSASFIVAPNLEAVQGIFQVSLSQVVKRSREPIKAYPVFNDPRFIRSHWAKIFVAMPFIEELRPIFDDHIKKVADELDISIKRGDDFSSTNTIMDEVWASIKNAELCIVDCTDKNANVFYELGIAHTLGSKTILITQSMDHIPFDIQHMRIITYDTTDEGLQEFNEKLRKTIVSELELDADA